MIRGNPIALALVMVGAIVMGVSTVLPLYESAGVFSRVQENTLIQSDGWLVIIAAIAIAASGYAARNGTAWGAPLTVSAIAAIGLLIYVSNDATHTLYPVSPDGSPDTTATGTVASFGIAVYVTALGIGLAAIGSLMLRNTTAGKKCPDCAETVLSDAQVCKHCGHRFPTAQPPEPVVQRRPVRCPFCSNVDNVPVTVARHPCSSCKGVMTLLAD